MARKAADRPAGADAKKRPSAPARRRARKLLRSRSRLTLARRTACGRLYRTRPAAKRPSHPVARREFQQGVATVRVHASSGLQSRPVQLGAQDGLNIEVAEGLSEGDEVVY